MGKKITSVLGIMMLASSFAFAQAAKPATGAPAPATASAAPTTKAAPAKATFKKHRKHHKKAATTAPNAAPTTGATKK